MCSAKICAIETLTPKDLEELDATLKNASWYEGLKYDKIDSIRVRYIRSTDNKSKFRCAMRLGNEYNTFKADSAYMYFTLAHDLAEAENDKTGQLEARIALIKALGVLGLYNEAAKELSLLEPLDMPDKLRAELYNCARQLYYYMMGYASWEKKYSKKYYSRNRAYRDLMLSSIDTDNNLYKVYHAERLMDDGNINLARDILLRITEELNERNPDYALAMSKLAELTEKYGSSDEAAHYMALSAIADTKCAIKDNESLLYLSKYLYAKGDIERAYRYLDASLFDANFCNARLRHMQIAKDMPIINQAYRDKTQQQNSQITNLLIVTVSLLVVIFVIGLLLAWQFEKQRSSNERLKQAHRLKEKYIGQFLGLCSIYMERLDSFTKLVRRKISTGQAEDLLKMTKSPKFAEEQNKLFYENFDSGFLNLYPNFVDEFNALLRPEERIEIKKPNTLTMELRIFAFLRLGIDDANKIAHFLRYSVNTVYTYRNKIRNKAINRDTFDDDIMEIGNINE